MACYLNFIVKDEGLLKVTGSHAPCKNDNISEKMLRCSNNRPLTGSDTYKYHSMSSTTAKQSSQATQNSANRYKYSGFYHMQI